MGQDRATPEKKLLELIESPGGNTLKDIKRKRKRIGFISPGAFKGRFAFFRGWIAKTLARQKPTLDIKEVNIILTVVVAGLIIYLAINWVDATNKSKEIFNLVSQPSIAEGKTNPFLPVSLLKDLAYYSQKVNSRNIFKLDPKVISSEEESETVEEKIVTPKDELLKLIEPLVLVGVSWSDDPIAMIENTETKTTYFLKRNQEVDKNIKIRQIFIDKVILEYKGTQVELKL